MADQPLNITGDGLAGLAALRAEAKFHERLDGYYPGAPDEASRLDAEQAVDRMLDRVAAGLAKSPTKAFVMSQFDSMLEAFDSPETEEREEICEYCERVMLVLGIDGSDGLLNRWLYGFDRNDVA